MPKVQSRHVDVACRKERQRQQIVKLLEKSFVSWPDLVLVWSVSGCLANAWQHSGPLSEAIWPLWFGWVRHKCLCRLAITGLLAALRATQLLMKENLYISLPH